MKFKEFLDRGSLVSVAHEVEVDGMSKTHIGNLRRGDVFILDGQKYKISGLDITKEINNVLCVGVKGSRIWLDIDTEVEVEE